MNHRRKLLTSMVVLPVAINFRLARAARTFKAYTYLPSATLDGAAGMIRMFERIAQDTGGEVKVDMNLGGSLPIKGNNITQAVGQGIVQFGDDGFFAGAVPQAGALRLPMLIHSHAEFERAVAAAGADIDAGFARQGVTVIGRYVYPKQVIFGRGVIGSLDDLRGKKMRVTSPEQGEFIRRFGGSPITIPTPELAVALERGVVDGILTASIGGGSFYKDLLKSNFRFGGDYFDSMIIANTDALAALPVAQRDIVTKAAADAGKAITAAMVEREPKVTRQLADGGMVVTEPSPADYVRASSAMADYWQSWAESKGPVAKTTVSKVRAALGR